MRMTPHGGGELVDLRCTDTERPALLERARGPNRRTPDAPERRGLAPPAVGGRFTNPAFFGKEDSPQRQHSAEQTHEQDDAEDQKRESDGARTGDSIRLEGDQEASLAYTESRDRNRQLDE